MASRSSSGPRLIEMAKRPRKYLVLLTHSSRPVDISRCDRNFLIRRYDQPDRLQALPAFTDLPSIEHHGHYAGGVSILELDLESEPAMRCLGFYDPGVKIQHAIMDRGRILVSLQEGLVVLDRFDALSDGSSVAKGARGRIDDGWFAGIHCAIPFGGERCVVAAAAPDAVLWVDLNQRQVIRRCRLPEDLYGRNYTLAATADLREHFVPNDLQLGHVNWAWPHRASVYVSTLIPGDIGRFNPDGSYERLLSGYIGCHGVRVTEDGETLYFSDSCRGSLVLCAPSGEIRRTVAVDSKWLHDAQHIDGDLFLLCVADHNRLDVVHAGRNEVLLSRHFDDFGRSIQFVSIARFDDAAASLGI